MELFETEYQKACNQVSDINEHIPILREYAERCDHVTEFGVREGTSTRAFMAATPKRLVSYDLALNPNVEDLFYAARKAGYDWHYHQANVLDIEIEETDFLFIDTLHNYGQMRMELALHASKVRQFIGFHDTVSFGEVGEGAPVGIRPAIDEFMLSSRRWQVVYDSLVNNGLMIIARIR